MLYSDLPQDQVVIGSASNTYDLHKLIERAVDDSTVPFVHFDVAEGGPMSCRILFQKEIPGFTKTTPLPRLFDCWLTAKEFFRTIMMMQSRWEPQESLLPQQVKGWQVSSAVAHGEKIVIVKAVWV